MSNGNGHRWSKFWWCDWQNDKALQLCSLAARGLWIELLGLCHASEQLGYLLINGEPPDCQQIADMLGKTSAKEIAKLLDELERRKVFSRTDTNTIFCRRMVRDADASAIGAAEVRKKWGDGELSGTTRARRLAEARKKATHTPEQWQAMVDAIGDRCLRCNHVAGDNGNGLVKDHIIPIYQGGSDGIENIQPMCRRCNAAKGPDTTDYRPPDWEKRLGECLGECLGADQMMPRSAPRSTPTRSLEAEAEEEAETPLTPRKRGDGGPPRFRNGFLQVIAEEGMPSTAGKDWFAPQRKVRHG